MNHDEILKILGTPNSPIAIGGYNSDSFDTDCQIYNLVVFDGKNLADVITKHESKIIKTSHGNISESNSETLLSYENLQINFPIREAFRPTTVIYIYIYIYIMTA